MDLLSLALQGCEKKRIDLKQFLRSNSGKPTRDATLNGLTDENLKDAEKDLSKVASSEQTEHGMKILRGFRIGATENEKRAAIVSFQINETLL